MNVFGSREITVIFLYGIVKDKIIANSHFYFIYFPNLTTVYLDYLHCTPPPPIPPNWFYHSLSFHHQKECNQLV